jgi:hypothetical protein
MNKITVSLVEKFKDKKIVVLAEETGKYAEILKTNGVKLLVGDISGAYFLQKAGINRASRIYLVSDNDKKNVKIAETALSAVKNRPEPLKCFILINDRALKTILEETVLFKNPVPNLEYILLNINELGIKYGISQHISRIVPARSETPPEILMVGLTEKTEIALLNLAHCLTMKREKFKFTILEENREKIRSFERKHVYLQDFAEIKFLSNLQIENRYASILIGSESQMEAIKKAISIRYLLGKNEPEILIFCDEPDFSGEVLQEELTGKNIFAINLFEEIAGYVFDLDENMEDRAKEAHRFWNGAYGMNKEWNALSGHFKQSNRNQILDNYVRTYIAFCKKFSEVQDISLTQEEKETLAMIEHRRWMIEKYDSGWTFGERNDPFKRHDCLKRWKDLPDDQKAKDYDAIKLMINLLNNNSIK